MKAESAKGAGPGANRSSYTNSLIHKLQFTDVYTVAEMGTRC